LRNTVTASAYSPLSARIPGQSSMWEVTRTFVAQTFANMWRYKLRSFLTMFGIAWGVVSLVLLGGLCDGFSEGQRDNMAQIGKDIVMVWGGRTEVPGPGQPAGRRIRLDQSDVEMIRQQASAIELVAGEVKSYGLSVTSDHNAGKFLTVGVNPDYLALRNFPLGDGRFISEQDVAEERRVAILGASVASQLFPKKAHALGERIFLRGIPYIVIGLLNEKTQNSSYDGWDNDKILVPDSILLKDAPSTRETRMAGALQAIIYRPASVAQWELAQRQVREVLARNHNFDPLDTNAINMWDTIESAQEFERIFSATEIFLSTIAIITLALGGVSVMNTMMMAVAERTNEIGLKKALGASRTRILAEFFGEGLALALLSGLVGSAAVFSLASAVNSLPLPEMFAGIPLNGKTLLIVSSTLVTVAVLSALPPAWRAAALTPVEALRFER
jgi:putative ABC transport system permease protein